MEPFSMKFSEIVFGDWFTGLLNLILPCIILGLKWIIQVQLRIPNAQSLENLASGLML